MKTSIVLSALTTMSLVFATAATSSEGMAPQELFESKCSACHPTSRPLGKNKDRAGWEKTVKRMQGKRSGHLSDAEVQTIVDYLTETRGK